MNELGNGRLTLEAMEQLFVQEGWHPQRLADQVTAVLQFSLSHGLLTCQVEFLPLREEFLVKVPAPVEIPEAQRTAVIEFISRANLGILMGGFEMDFSSNEVRFKQGISFLGAPFFPEILRATCIHAVQTTDLYLPGLTGMLYGGQQPLEALQTVTG